MEISPLARAEWMRIYGLLFGCQEKADKLFAEVDKNYNNLKKQAQDAGVGRTVLFDKIIGNSVWYVPGGRSTMGQMIQDAVGNTSGLMIIIVVRCPNQFQAYQSGEVYGCNVRTSLFYEEAPFRPDKLLSDFIQIMHPGIKPCCTHKILSETQALSF